ncbi:MAG TPA: hypothetical protein VGM62_04630 [Chthoniobacterales bacterium]|jgi:hypothetical protein
MKRFSLLLSICLFLLAKGQAVILLDTGDPGVNTAAPAGALTDSGWQYEASWGGFLGTPIAPNFFISAAHIGQAGNGLIFQGTTYPVIGSYSLPGSDLMIWKVGIPFTTFAPIYTKNDEIGHHLVVIGRGTQRGGQLVWENTIRGWYWGRGDGVRRWGENDIADVVPYSGHDLLYATFDQHVVDNDHPNETHLSSGDSGGAVFLNDSGAWKVAGINYAVDGPFWFAVPPLGQAGETQFEAALFDATGLYEIEDTIFPYVQIPGPGPTPTGFYASRISSELAWIASVIADPRIGREGNYLTLTYWRLTVPSTDIVYEVDRSSDLASWELAATRDEVVASVGDFEQIKAKIDPVTINRLFVRLQVTRPENAAEKVRSTVTERRVRIVPLSNR